MTNLIQTITYIVQHSNELKNHFTSVSSAPIEFACIFCQTDEEYQNYTQEIKLLGKIVETTPTGYTYLLQKPISTVAGFLRLIKIRKPDPNRPERGDADFNTNYSEFKKRYKHISGFELVKRNSFEMLRLSSPDFDVMACFSNIPKSKSLGIKTAT
ncbi:hypothetical protein GYA49_00795 [Candidatus Beckwithbacteria bacterium]|nr:hypothetical protein [Candidatus Beckwithbacteria bacterium]